MKVIGTVELVMISTLFLSTILYWSMGKPTNN